VLKLSGETAKSPKELADALFVVTSAGLRGKEALSALEQSAKAGAAGLGETTDIARSLAGAMNAYGPSVVSAARATDMIVATARAGNFETSQFAGAIGRILPFAQQVGASLEDMGGAVALLTRTNGDAAQSVTQVAALFRAFVVPTEEAKKALNDVGLSASDLRKAISEQGLPAALKMLDNSLGGNREQLGRLLGSSEAVAAAFQILDADAQTITDTFGAVNDAVGITDEAFNIVADTAGFKIQQAFVGLKNSLMEFGDIISPFVEQLAGMVSKLVTFFKELDSATKKFILSLGALAVAIGPLLIGLGAMAKALVAVKTASAFLIANPYVLVAAGVVALIGYYATLISRINRTNKMLGEPIDKSLPIDDQIQSAIQRVEALDKRVANMTKNVGVGTTTASGVQAQREQLENAQNQLDLERQRLVQLIAQRKANVANTNEQEKQLKILTEISKKTGAFAFSGGGIESADMGTEGELKVRTVDTETYANAVGYLGVKLKQVKVATDDATNGFKSMGQQAIDFNQNLQSVLTSSIGSFAETIGNAFTGDAGAEGFFNNILMIVADFGTQLGKSLVAAGIAALSFQKLLLNPVGAIAAGTALIATSAIVKNLLKSSPSQSVNDAMITKTGKVIKFHPDDNILAMKDFSNLGGGGGGSVKVQMVASPVRITNKEIVFAFTQGQTDWSR
jgi:TP901 family phage tail tape measure protein